MSAVGTFGLGGNNTNMMINRFSLSQLRGELVELLNVAVTTLDVTINESTIYNIELLSALTTLYNVTVNESTIIPIELTTAITTINDVILLEPHTVQVELLIAKVTALDPGVVLINDGGDNWWNKNTTAPSWIEESINTGTWVDKSKADRDWADSDAHKTNLKPTNCKK